MAQNCSSGLFTEMREILGKAPLAKTAIVGILLSVASFIFTNSTLAEDELEKTIQRHMVYPVEPTPPKDEVTNSEHYHLDKNTGTLRFGDGARGQRLPTERKSPSGQYRPSSDHGDEATADPED